MAANSGAVAIELALQRFKENLSRNNINTSKGPIPEELEPVLGECLKALILNLEEHMLKVDPEYEARKNIDKDIDKWDLQQKLNKAYQQIRYMNEDDSKAFDSIKKEYGGIGKEILTLQGRLWSVGILELFKEANILNISFEQIMEGFEDLEYGVTNKYITVKDSQNNKYLVRINGTLWPPYERSFEEHALGVMETIGIQTGVLHSGDKFQICMKHDKKMKFDEILKTKNPEEITKALALIAEVMKKYHDVQHTKISYPINKMINDSLYIITKKFDKSKNRNLRLFSEYTEPSVITDTRKEINEFKEICHKIITILHEQARSSKYANSHNDTLPSSIFVDTREDKIWIVDWEYAALSFRTNDLAILCAKGLSDMELGMTDDQVAMLAKQYYEGGMSEDDNYALKLNIFLHMFLTVAWKMKPENMNEFIVIMEIMKRDIKVFNGYLETKYQEAIKHTPIIRLSSGPQNSAMWMPTGHDRGKLMDIFDKKMFGLTQAFASLPDENYKELASKIGWQFFVNDERKEYMAVLNITQLDQATEFANKFKGWDTKLIAEVGSINGKPCLVITMSKDIADKIEAEVEKVVTKSQMTKGFH